MNIPIKYIGIVAILIILGSGIGYITAHPQTIIQTITQTRTVEKSNILTETTTATLQMRETMTSSIAGESTTTTITITPGENTTTTTTTPEGPKGWTTIYTFQGFNDTITEDFNISRTQWQIKYKVESRGGPFHFIMYVYRSGYKGSIYEEYVTKKEAGSHTLLIKKYGPDWYLDIKSKNVKWTIEVQIE